MELNLSRSQESKDKPKRDQKRAFDDAVNEERAARLLRGFVFQGHRYSFDTQSAVDIAGAGATALDARINGAVQGDFNWEDPNVPFTWRTMDNVVVPMDAHTVWEFSQAAMRHRKAHVYASSQIKDAETPPSNWKDDEHWPDSV